LGRVVRDYSIHPSARSGQPVIEAPETDLDPELARTLRTLNAGQTSQVVAAKSGFFLLRREP